jgi:integrase
VQLLVVSRRLGHKSISITADQYAHVIVDDQKEAVDKYEQLVKAAKS